MGVIIDPEDPPPKRRRRLHGIQPDRHGIISFLLTLCVSGRAPVLANDLVFDRFVRFLLDSPERYRWFGRRFVIMPDHLHLIVHQGAEAVPLGNWVKALKAVVSGRTAASSQNKQIDGRTGHACAWQAGFHDHKFRTPESETRKWEYICLNPVRYGLVKRPEEWKYGGEIFYEGCQQPVLSLGVPELLEKGILIREPMHAGEASQCRTDSPDAG